MLELFLALLKSRYFIEGLLSSHRAILFWTSSGPHNALTLQRSAQILQRMMAFWWPRSGL